MAPPGTIDYARLRDQTLGSQQEEEAVTVNTRALIDKVLARYSGEWTTLRELIQNAADASATKVVIKFETLPSATVPTPQSTSPADQLKHIILNHTTRRLVVTNNGQPFSESDWSRLKRIAEGNPDETKIGAFGVGFYSVFSDCDNPFVTSGKDSLAFFWKGNSLFTRRAKLPAEHPQSDTCFVLDNRSTTSPVPNLMSLSKFLSTSLTFIGLESVELWLDDFNVFTLSRKAALTTEVPLPKDIETKTKDALLRITAVESQNIQIDAEWINIIGWTPPASNNASSVQDVDNRVTGTSLRSFFSRLTGSAANASKRIAYEDEKAAQKALSEDLGGKSKATAFIRVTSVHIKSQVANSFASELERATKKNPPKTTKIQILTSSYDETLASLSTLSGPAGKKAEEIIGSILPRKHGRIFIGFPTAQTTGLLAHISAPSLIPTVERENIDLNARYVRSWNSEILSIAGIACRIAYGGEMVSLRQKFASAVSNKGADVNGIVRSLLPAAVHTLQQFTISEATPLAKAGQIIEESFWTCSRKPYIDIFSSRGVLPSSEVRMASEDLSFVDGIPLVPEQLMKESGEFINKIVEFGLLTEITASDIRRELEKQALTEDQLMEFLRWVSHKRKINELDSSVVQSMFSVTVADVTGSEPSSLSQLLVLGQIESYLNTSKIPPELPVPAHTIPFRFTKGLTYSDMQSFGWEELQIVPWLRWLVELSDSSKTPDQRRIAVSADFSAQVLAVLSKGWDGLSQSSKASVTELLSSRAVIPTKQGLKRPAETYFSSVKIFEDIPTILSMAGVKEKFLKALGVRKTIELDVIFERLMAKPSSSEKKEGWSHVDLIRYLISVWSDIPSSDIERLKDMPLCPVEDEDSPTKPTVERFKLSQLYMPKAELRSIGLPILHWPSSFSDYSPEGKFLRSLGLRMYPSVPELVDIAAKAHAAGKLELYEAILRYFIAHHYNNNYGSFDIASLQTPFLPLEDRDSKRLYKPADCYSNPKAAILRYPIFRQDLRINAEKFGVKSEPPIQDCTLRLIKSPPQSKTDAKDVFSYFASRIHDVSKPVVDKLSGTPIVPIATRSSVRTGASKTNPPQWRLVAPTDCFLGEGTEYADIFDYVDFGPDANQFLLRIGSKHEPSIVELTQLLTREPARILKTIGADRYKNLLRKLHVNTTLLRRDKILWKEMRKAPFLLAEMRKPKIKARGSLSKTDKIVELLHDDDEAEDPQEELEISLSSADRILILDDLQFYKLFQEHVLVAPEEDSLEELYQALGARNISDIVEEEPRIGSKVRNQDAAYKLRDLILERTRLFLYEQRPELINHDIKWLDKNLEVQMVQSVSIRRILRGPEVEHTQKRTAALTPTAHSKAFLSVTQGFDMWEVSNTLVHLLLARPKTQSILILETLLNTSLSRLRERGYNVDRILRRKAKEAQVAELEKQQREEQQRLEREKAARAEARHVSKNSQELSKKNEEPQTPKVNIPGAFNDSPEQPHSSQKMLSDPSRQGRQPQGILSTISRHLGLDDSSSRSFDSQLANKPQRTPIADSFRNQSQPPPYTPFDLGQSQGSKQVERVTAPDKIQQNLNSAISSSRSFGSSSLISPPQTNQIKEVSSYCDSRPGQNLSFLGSTSAHNMKVYLSQDSTIDRAEFLRMNQQGLDAFASLLSAVSRIFPLPKDTVNIYFDEKGNTVAFNTNGSLFCNYRFFAQLHVGGLHEPSSFAQSFVYWWVVLCHELAHNLVSDHSSNHSFYTESFVMEYFPKVAVALSQIRN